MPYSLQLRSQRYRKSLILLLEWMSIHLFHFKYKCNQIRIENHSIYLIIFLVFIWKIKPKLSLLKYLSWTYCKHREHTEKHELSVRFVLSLVFFFFFYLRISSLGRLVNKRPILPYKCAVSLCRFSLYSDSGARPNAKEITLFLPKRNLKIDFVY